MLSPLIFSKSGLKFCSANQRVLISILRATEIWLQIVSLYLDYVIPFELVVANHAPDFLRLRQLV